MSCAGLRFVSKCDDPTCRGWEWFNDREIQRCDSCGRFKDDEAAMLHVQGCVSCREYLRRQTGALTIPGFAGWDSISCCNTGEIGCRHGYCDTCADCQCFPPGERVKRHKCTHASHGG